MEAPDGYYRILGRIDDVINVSGHRLGTKELESAALVVEEVAESAVVPVKDDEVRVENGKFQVVWEPRVGAMGYLVRARAG